VCSSFYEKACTPVKVQLRETAWPADLSGGIKATLADETHSLIVPCLPLRIAYGALIRAG
jgi:hypothetical protein